MQAQKNNILLILAPTEQSNAKSHMPPLGLAYLANSLRDKGLSNTTILDTMLYENHEEKIIEELKRLKPKICGVSFATPNRFKGFEVCKLIKKHLPETIVVVGGPHVSFTEEDTLNRIKEIDIVVVGEGEKTFTEIVEGVYEGEAPLYESMQDIKGIAYRDKKGKVIINERRKPIPYEELSPLQPAYDLLELEKYQVELPFHKNLKTITVISQRGCPHGCNYCSTTKFWGLRIRPRDVKDVVDEMEMLAKKHGYEGIYIFDDCFTFFKKRVLEFCDEIKKRKLNIKWSCSGRVNNLDDEVVKALVEAGCVFIALGVESGSQRLLDRMHKAITIEQVLESKKLCEKHKLNKKYWFIYGHPTETKQELRKTVKLINKLNPEFAAISFMRIFPGTEIEMIAKKEEILPKDFSWNEEYVCPNKAKLDKPDNNNIFYVPKTLSIKDLKAAYQIPLIFSRDFVHPSILFNKFKRASIREYFDTAKRYFRFAIKKKS